MTVSTVYLDTTVLITFLYGKRIEPERFEQSRPLFAAMRDSSVEGVISFYALPELYDYVEHHQPADEVNAVFRLSLVELFSLPITVAPFLDRAEFDQLRKQIQIPDPVDTRHTAVALSRKCDAIITFDHHFAQISNLILVYTPAEFLATLKPRESTSDVE